VQSNNEKTVLPTDERAEARDRLARQFGKLVALEWLQELQTRHSKSPPDVAVPSAPDTTAKDT